MKQRRLIVARSAALDIQRRNRWWRKHRKDAPLLFGRAIRAAYAALAENAGLGTSFEDDDVEGVFRYVVQPTQHWLYYVVKDQLPVPAYVAVLGIEGPGEAGPPDLVKAAREI